MPACPTAAPRLPWPHPACTAPRVVGNGSIQGRQRSHCRSCGAWFGEPHGTPVYRLRRILVDPAARDPSFRIPARRAGDGLHRGAPLPPLRRGRRAGNGRGGA